MENVGVTIHAEDKCNSRLNQESSEDTFPARDAIVDPKVTGEQVQWVAHSVVQLLDLGAGSVC